MNDCFWCFIKGCCDGEGCIDCTHYLSVNSEEGMKIYTEYENEVEKYLEPLYEKMRSKMNEYKTN